MPFIIDVIKETTTAFVKLSRVADSAHVPNIFRTFPRAFNAAIELAHKLQANGLVNKAAGQMTDTAAFIKKVREHTKIITVDLEYFKNFHVYPGLLSPKISRGGELFGKYLPPLDGMHVADICAGTGIIGMHALERCNPAKLTFLDIVPQSIRNIKRNLDHFKFTHKAQVLKSDLYSAVSGTKFDCVLSNPPYIPVEKVLHHTNLDIACYDQGGHLMQRLIKDTRRHTVKGGEFHMLVSDQANLPNITSLFQDYKWHPQNVLIEGAPSGHLRIIYDVVRGL